MLIHDYLRTSSIFSKVSPEDIQVLEGFCYKQVLEVGDVLIHENDIENYDIFLVCEGSLEVVTHSSDTTSAEAVISKQCNDVIGEIAWLTRERRTATVKAYSPVEVIRVDGNALQNFVDEYPGSGSRIMRSIALLLARNLTNADKLLKQILWNNMI